MSSRAPGFLGLTWDEVRSLAPARAPGGHAATTMVHSEDHHVAAAWWPRGSRTEVHGHAQSETWLHVLVGEVVEERYLQSETGEWSCEKVRVGAGESTHLPKGALHRIVAHRDASVIRTYSPAPKALSVPPEPSQLPALRSARRRAEDAGAERTTLVGAMAPWREAGDA